MDGTDIPYSSEGPSLVVGSGRNRVILFSLLFLSFGGMLAQTIPSESWLSPARNGRNRVWFRVMEMGVIGCIIGCDDPSKHPPNHP
jgi:hypothetical protein